MCVKILSTSQDILGLAAFKCQAYTRALMYLEMFLSANGSAINDHLAFLQVSSVLQIFNANVLVFLCIENICGIR